LPTLKVKSRLRAANGRGSGCKNVCNNLPTNTARFSPLRQRKRRSLSLRSQFGDVKLVVDYGQPPQSQEWFCPVQRRWGMSPHQKITPGFAEKLCFTVTATGSYEEAAAVASQWGSAMDDSTLHAVIQRVGAQAQIQTQERLKTLPSERQPQRLYARRQ